MITIWVFCSFIIWINDICFDYFGFTLEICAGYYLEYKDKFASNNFHPQGGVLLVNIREFRKDELLLVRKYNNQ